MKPSISDSLIEASEAEDILQYLALGILKSRGMELKTQPSLNVLELYNWMPDNQQQFAPQGDNTTLEQTPLYAVVDKNLGDGHFCFEAFQRLRDCYDAGEYIVKPHSRAETNYNRTLRLCEVKAIHLPMDCERKRGGGN